MTLAQTQKARHGSYWGGPKPQPGLSESGASEPKPWLFEERFLVFREAWKEDSNTVRPESNLTRPGCRHIQVEKAQSKVTLGCKASNFQRFPRNNRHASTHAHTVANVSQTEKTHPNGVCCSPFNHSAHGCKCIPNRKDPSKLGLAAPLSIKAHMVANVSQTEKTHPNGVCCSPFNHSAHGCKSIPNRKDPSKLGLAAPLSIKAHMVANVSQTEKTHPNGVCCSPFNHSAHGCKCIPNRKDPSKLGLAAPLSVKAHMVANVFQTEKTHPNLGLPLPFQS